ncbi:MAG: DUF2169 domain-containing protein [Variovorax sp.]|nr:MAG: DUF2169 domain-containing protein [Variovorax sp.]
MKTIKPLRLSLMSRPYRWEGKHILGVSALGLVSLASDPKLFSEQDLWQLVSEEIGPGNTLDLGVPKSTPEWLISGYGYTAHQKDKTICAVQARVGGQAKSLTVSGDRYWLAGRMTAPQPFERMPLDWAHAFGGAEIAENPLGIGTVDEQINGVHTRRLPNVEAPDARMVSHGQRIRPAGFGGIPPDWPQRTRMLGSDYGQDWLEHRFPGLAADADWRYFNAAAPDQHWVGAHEVPHEAAYELWNMHPTQAVLRGTLPPWQVRCFVSRKKDGSDLQESQMRMTTVWMFPHAERAVLIWQGAFAIAQDDAADVQHLMAAIELPDAPRTMSHYESVLGKRLDPAQAVHAVRDSDLAPKSILGPWVAGHMSDMMARPMVRNARAGELRRHEERRRELLRKGLDPEQYLPPLPEIGKLPELDDLPEYSDRLQAQMDAAMSRGAGAGEAEVAGIRPLAASGAETRPPSASGRLHNELDALRARTERSKTSVQGHGGASDGQRLDPDQTIARLHEKHERELNSKSMSVEEVREAEAAHEKEAERIRRGHRYVAHLQDPAPVASSARSAKLRRRLGEVEPALRRFARMNLAGVNLSGLDLRGADFSSANLEDADLRGAQLDGCNFSSAVLARARMAQASLVNARLDHANLGGAQCDGTDFSGAHLSQATCQKTQFRNCLFVGAQFENNNLQESVWQRCDLSRSRWTQVTFLKLSLQHMLFEEAEFRQVVWIECVLGDISFVKARLAGSSFVTTEGGNGVDFSGAALEVCSFAHGSAMAGAVFRGATLKQCGLRTTCLDAADFRDAHLLNCDLSECRLVRARMDRLTGGESLFIRADLTGASLRNADLVDTNFSKADFRLADLGEANLFRADVSQAWIDSSTNLEGAYTHRAKIWPARSLEANQ